MTDEEAFAALGLKPGASPGDVKTEFRRHVMDAHPDKGGTIDGFSALRTAYNQAFYYAVAEPCPTCKGVGRKTIPSGGLFIPMTITCPDCEGSGKKHNG